MEQAEFFQNHLDRVSRSFAFCIRQLPTPLREWIGLSYLLCRIVDTIEDSSWLSPVDQAAAFDLFDRALIDPAAVPELRAWASRFPPRLPAGELALLDDATQLFEEFHRFPSQVRDMIRDLVLSMSRGMQHFCAQREGGALHLKSLAEVNQYCFFVAGVVGELLAKLIARVEPRFRLSPVNVRRAHHFGLFLQKVNLLKDQVADEQEGRHLIPSREMVENSSHTNARQALDFLLDVPKEQLEFRRFCAWSLFLGLQALAVARESLRRKEVLKVSRPELEAILERVEPCLGDDGALRGLFDQLTHRLGWSSAVRPHAEAVACPDWILRLYPGPLDGRSLTELGLVTG